MHIPLFIALLALTATACSKGTPTADRSPSPSVSASATTDDQGSPSASPKPRARADDREPTGSAAPAPPPPGRAPQHAPPASGTYRYSQSGKTTFGAISSEPDPEGTLVVERAVAQDGGLAQKHVRRLSSRAEITSVYLFTPDAVLLTYISQQGVECAPEPALTALKLPLKVGTTWESKGVCGDITAEVSGEVMAEETRTIGGEKVETFRVHIATQIRADAFWQSSGAKVWISPAHRLVVKSEEASRGSFNGASFESSLNADLLSLKAA
jgi:hypothetical protein